jgi:outer membrane autotransporter protein
MASAFSSSFATKKAAIASSSLLALSAVLGWSSDASAAGTCGAPSSGGLVNCTHEHYASGIEYSGADAIDDLTLNVGSFAGQHNAVSVQGSGVSVSSPAVPPTSDTSESVNVGKNVTIDTSGYADAIMVTAESIGANYSASATVDNAGKIVSTGGDGIDASTLSSFDATTQITNSGSVSSYSDGLRGQSYATASALASNTVSANTTVTNSGAVSTSGDYAFGIASGAESISISAGVATGSAYAGIANSAGVSTVGYDAQALRSISESDSLGASAYSTAVASVTNSGAITTQGTSASAIYALSEAVANSNATLVTVSAMATSTVNNSGTLATSGDGSIGIGAISYASGGMHNPVSGTPYTGIATATTTVTNTGSISTKGVQGGTRNLPADGIYAGAEAMAYGFRNAYATSVVRVTNSGAITTSGESAAGIYASARSKAYGAVGCINCLAAGYSVGASYATVGNSGAVTTRGNYASAIAVSTMGSGKSKFGSYSYDESAVNNSGALKTSGAHSTGISVLSTGYGAFQYFSIANVSTTAAVNNSGAISTSGGYSTGIDAVSYSKSVGLRRSAAYSNVFITNTGSISTTGTSASDIVAESIAYSAQGNGYVHGVSYVTNGGALTATGERSDGILSVVNGYSTRPSSTYHSGVGQVFAVSGVGNSGRITVSGSYADGIASRSRALAASYYYSQATAYATAGNSGAIKTTGVSSIGMFANAYASNFTRPSSSYFSQALANATVSNSGSIAVSGHGAAGISVFSYALAFGGSTATATATANAINTGSISASAQYADGISAISDALVKKAGSEGTVTATTYATNAGSITAKNGTGIFAEAFSYNQNGAPGISGSGSATASILVKNSGTIVAGGDGITALASFDGGGGVDTISTTATVQNTGSITVTGDSGEGIDVGSGGLVAPGTATVVNSGTIAALGADGVGVGVSAYTTTVVNAAGGLINASGAGGVGVSTDGPQSTIVTYAASTISGGTGAGAAGVYMHGVLNTIANGGTITSANDAAIHMSAYAANVISNAGTITGMVTMTTGAKGQNVLYNYGTWNAVGGNSSFTHGAGGGSNLVNERGGSIVVVGNQTFEGLDVFTNIGLVTMTQAASVGLGSRPAFETLVVSGDYEAIGGALAVDASTVGGMHGDELKIDGAASGSTKIMPTIVGTPGATTGNGIILVSSHATTGASNFILAGNAANGDEVAGAFEYNLTFDPGKGTSGQWYLRSQVYPGAYQFGQTQSSALLVSDQVNPSLDDLMNQAFNGTVANASLVDSSQEVASNDPTFVPAPNGTGLSGWGRFDEARFNVNPSGSPFAGYKLRVDSMQIGLDGTWHNAGSLVMFGGYITPFHAWSDFASFGGHIGMSGTAYGLYGLWFSGPWQAGLRLNTDNATAHFTDTFIGSNAFVKPYERGAQAAVSYDMPLNWANFTPSAEFNYGTVNGVHFTDGAGDLVQVGSTNDVWAKLNGRFSWDVETARNLLVQPYVNLSIIYRADTSTHTIIDTFSASTNVNGWDGDLAVGVNTNLAAGLSLSAQADYLAGDRVKGWTGFIGLRYTP